MKIMVCFDGSEETKEGLKVAGRHAQACNGEVLVITSQVIDDKDYPKRLEPIEKSLEEAKAYLDEIGIPYEALILFRGFEDSAGEHLLTIAKEYQVGEIIVGISTRSKVEKLILGSVAQFVILKAECPVVCVKRKRP